MPLTMAKPGDTVTIRKITGKDEVRRHLAELGFVVGETVTVINVLGGNLILQVKDSRIALVRSGPGIAGPGGNIRGGILMKTLKDLNVGQQAVVVRLHGEGPVRRRIMDMGLTKGTQVYLRKVAPLGDPLELTVRNYELSIRKADAAMVEIE